MIRKGIYLCAALCLCVGLTGCMGVASPAVGVLYSEVAWDGPVTEGALGTKQGKACAQSILVLVAQGDASVEAAAKAGGITKIHQVDHTSKNILGILGEYCTIVHGD